jgi:hypothetical protein
MSISERTRKILWITAGGRCSICRVQLATERTDSDDPSVFGEEAHIVAQSDGGPRGGQMRDADSYDNLILLCRMDHKRVDDQVGYYTVARLREIKRAHETWIRTLGDAEHVTQLSADARIARLQRRAETVRREQAQEQDRAARFWAEAPAEVREHDRAVIPGQGSKVVELDLTPGGYRMKWESAGRGYLVVRHETAWSGQGRRLIGASSPDASSGEALVRFDGGERQVFSVTADRLSWVLTFSRL